MNMKKIVAGAVAFCLIGGAVTFECTTPETTTMTSYAGVYTGIIPGNPRVVDGIQYSVSRTDNDTHAIEDDISFTYNYAIVSKGIDVVDVVIPSTYTYIIDEKIGKEIELAVKEIRADAFVAKQTLISVELPETIKKIGTGAFKNCRNFEKLVIPNDDIIIEDKAIQNCPKVKIYAHVGSNAYNYAIANGIPFVDLDTGKEYPETTTTTTATTTTTTKATTTSTTTTTTTTTKAPTTTSTTTTTTTTTKAPTTTSTTTTTTTTTKAPTTTSTTTTTTTTTKAPTTTSTTTTTTTTTKAPTTTSTTATTTTTTTATDVEVVVTLLGDANCDGEVNIADATAIIQSIGNKDRYALSEQGEKNADCYNPGDGVTGMDAIAIQKLEANMIGSLPEIE